MTAASSSVDKSEINSFRPGSDFGGRETSAAIVVEYTTAKAAGELTYMSIRAEIRDRVERGMLHPLLPTARRAAPRRLMFVTESLWELLNSPEGDAAWEERIGNLRAELERFVVSQTLDPKYLFLLYPARDCVWEIRCTAHDPSIRVLGFFASKDVFVATNFALREELKGWQSRAWREVKRQAGAEWRRVMLTYPPRAEIEVNKVISGALNGKYFRSNS